MASAFTSMTQLRISSYQADSSIMHALYAVPVRRPAILPPASFRPCLTATPLLLASDLELFAPSCTRSGLSPPNQCPCRANQRKPAHPMRRLAFFLGGEASQERTMCIFSLIAFIFSLPMRFALSVPLWMISRTSSMWFS